jgi:hypothetical protein
MLPSFRKVGPCHLQSQSDIATILLDQDLVRQGVPRVSLRLFSKSTRLVFRHIKILEYVAVPRHINPYFLGNKIT